MAKLHVFANSGDPDQMPHSVASDLGLHCLLINLLGVSRLKWDNLNRVLFARNLNITEYVSLRKMGNFDCWKYWLKSIVMLDTKQLFGT